MSASDGFEVQHLSAVPGSEAPQQHPRAAGGSDRGRQSSERRVRDLVRAAIEDGVFDEDLQLDETTLIESLSATRSAIRRALQQLTHEGLLERRPRFGTYPRNRSVRLVLDDITDVPGSGVGAERPRVRIRITDTRPVPASGLIRSLLACDDETVHMMENLFVCGDLPIGVRTAYFPTSYPVLDYDGPAEMGAVGQTVFNTEEMHAASTRIGATVADAATARILKITPGSAVLTRQQVFVGAGDLPVQAVFDHYRADLVTFQG
ncbi:GntR family transcriptional regulator [Nocardioides sp. C4-1]|uniref:GntR family transcriptional regulator n=1 Tax=Nocardioides sp. C4-1 TaxID=3151851 RepID=UPI0032668D20